MFGKTLGQKEVKIIFNDILSLREEEEKKRKGLGSKAKEGEKKEQKRMISFPLLMEFIQDKK